MLLRVATNLIYFNGNYFVAIGLILILQMYGLAPPLISRLYNPIFALSFMLALAFEV